MDVFKGSQETGGASSLRLTPQKPANITKTTKVKTNNKQTKQNKQKLQKKANTKNTNFPQKTKYGCSNLVNGNINILISIW